MKTIQVTYREMISVENVKTIEVTDEVYLQLEDEKSSEYCDLEAHMNDNTEWYKDFDSKDTYFEIKLINHKTTTL